MANVRAVASMAESARLRWAGCASSANDNNRRAPEPRRGELVFAGLLRAQYSKLLQDSLYLCGVSARASMKASHGVGGMPASLPARIALLNAAAGVRRSWALRMLAIRGAMSASEAGRSTAMREILTRATGSMAGSATSLRTRFQNGCFVGSAHKALRA